MLKTLYFAILFFCEMKALRRLLSRRWGMVRRPCPNRGVPTGAGPATKLATVAAQVTMKRRSVRAAVRRTLKLAGMPGGGAGVGNVMPFCPVERTENEMWQPVAPGG